ncbi:pPIWI-associating nuclease domain-containing protein [Xenorhabdus sp. Sc-CR9]|uniref:pPIWI-associating nuclease domain-containing protein n=1 Tax=Xenorhabdus sp. Sc-CR9 TaxID=2584468 RepID=UPI001F2B8DB2|nr:hypothetical protein [Xenorhabdus sp. Sc-CR9]
MITEIEKTLAEGFERDLFLASERNLDDKYNPLRLNNYSYAMRELTRHILHRLAPDQNVLNCVWYKNETDKDNGITRKQRAYYAVQGGLQDVYVQNILGLAVEEIHKDLVSAINKLSKFTHIEPKVFGLPDAEIDVLVNETREAVYGFLVTMSACRKLIIDSLWEQIGSAVINETLKETIQSLDELASHHFIDEVYTDKVEICKIDHEYIMFRVEGSIGCELQWGSNSDVGRGDGIILPQSFPFECELLSPVHSPEFLESVEGTLSVDTSSWYKR